MNDPWNVLVLFAHPMINKSRVNKTLIRGLAELEHVTFHDLYAAYPELDIDVRHEQLLLSEHQVVVLMHPFYWYSTPPLLKQWFDLVLEHGWAYGHGGTALQGKVLLNAITAGGGAAAYQHGGYNRFTVRELLAPIEQTAHLCQMVFLPPYVVYGTHALDAAQLQQQRLNLHALLRALAARALDPSALTGLADLNETGAALVQAAAADHP